MVVGSGRLVVVKVIQASVQETSSSFRFNDLLSGGSVVSQDLISRLKLITRKPIITRFIFIFLKTNSYLALI